MTVNQGIVSLSAVFVAAAASAQSGPSLPYSISVGWNYLLDSGARNLTTTSGYTATLGYHFSSTGVGMSSMSNLDSAVEASYGQFSGHGAKLNQYSLLLVERAPFSAGGSSKNSGFSPYYGLGLGIIRNQFIGNGEHSVGASGAVGPLIAPSASNYTLAAKALVGVKFSQAIFAEAAYNYNGSDGGKRLDTVSVSVGLRF